MKDYLEGLKKFFDQATADKALGLVGALALFFSGLLIIRWVGRLFDRYLDKSKLDKGITSFLSSLVNILLKFILLISVASSLGVPNTSFIAILSSMGLAIGLALQGSLGNFAGGLMLLWFHPFRVGDYIKTPDAEGSVTSMNIMYTQLSTFDGKMVVVPNSKLSNGVLTNFSAQPTRRVDIPFTLAYESDVDKVKALMEGQANAHQLVLKDPAPAARLGSFDGGRPVYTLRCWCNTKDYWAVTFDLIEGLKREFDQRDISVAPPATHLHIKEGSLT